MWPESPYFPVLAAVCVIAFTIVYALWRRFRNVAGRETESQREINEDTYIPATLLKHAKACKRNIHEVPRDDNSLFSALADQLTDAPFTGLSLRDDIETFISGRWPSEQHESFLLSNSRHDTRPTIQDAADFLRHNIVLYRDDDNPPYLIQPNVDGPDPTFQVLHIGCINNKYYVSFRPHGYNQGFHNVAGREKESQHEINVDTCVPATLLKHAKACNRNIHEVPRDDNSLFSALADQLTDATFTGQSLRDDIETFISGRWPSEQHESFLLSNPNSRHDTRPTIQDAADFLRHNIVLYRDDDNPPYLIQPNVDRPDPTFQVLHIGSINSRYYVSFRPHGYNQGQGASVSGNTDSDEDRSDTDSENVNFYRVTDDRTMINIGDNNQTTVVADAKGSTSVKSLSYGNNNHFTLNIIVHKKDNTYVERMIDSGLCVGDKVIRLKINISGISQEEIERAERSVIEHRIKIQENINAKIRSHGVELSMLGLGCLLICFRPKSWLNCRAFIMGLRLHSEKYLDIFRQLLTAFQHINDLNNLTMDVKISIGQLSEGTNLSDCISWTELKDIGQERDMDKTPPPFEKKDVGKNETTTDPRSDRSVGKDDKLSLKVFARPVGDKSSLSSTDLEKVAVRTVEQVLEFKEADVPYIPHTKTHDQMTTIQRPVEKRRDRREVRPEKKHINVRIPEDKEACAINACCHLNDGSLMVADLINRRLKRIDPSSSKVTKFCDTDGNPIGVCCIGPQEVAVAFFDSTEVHVYNTVSLTRTRTVELGHVTSRIACHGGLLYCAECNGTILFVHDVRSGWKLREISMYTYSCIRQIAVNSSGDRLYVADPGRGLVCVFTDGVHMFCLSNHDLGLSAAWGVTTDHNGHVFVCGADSQNVVKVTEDGHVVGQILSKEDGIERPGCLSYDVNRSSLYVGGGSDQLLMVEWK